MKTKHISFTRNAGFGSVSIPMFGARVVNGLFRKTEMNQTNKITKEKLKVSAVLLPLCLALSAHPASAADEALVNGANAGFVDISGPVYVPLASRAATVPVTSVGSTWNCAVTCSAEVVDDGFDLFVGVGTLAILDDGVVVPGSERTFEMVNNFGVQDVGRIVVSTTAKTTMNDSSDPDTFACAARELSPGIDIANSSISFVCTDLP